LDDGAFHVAVALGTDRECDQGLGEPSLRVERCGQLLIDGCEEAFVWGGSRLMAPAAIATLPMWMRHLGGFDQPAAVDAAIVPAARMAVRAMSLGNSRPMLAVARWLVPHTAEVYAQHLAAGTPAAPRTVTPAEARETLAYS